MSTTTKQTQPLAPLVLVCAGGGGVGKTTSSAALAWALASQGLKTLVVTVDPARRLADALGVTVDCRAHVVNVDPALGDRLWALMPEPRQSTRDFIEDLFAHEREALRRLLENKLYQTIEDKLAGMHELAAVTLVVRTLREQSQGPDGKAFDAVIIDTAPSRNALDFIAYPQRLAKLLDGQAVVWISKLAERARTADAPKRFSLLNWGRQQVEGVLGRVLGAGLLQDLAALFGELSSVRERFATLAQHSHDLLLGDRTRYLMVSAPTGAARADVSFLMRALGDYQRRPEAILLNRADINSPAWLQTLIDAPEGALPAAVRGAARRLDAERVYRTRAADDTTSYFGRAHPGIPMWRLPYIEADSPAEIVRTLSLALAPYLPKLLRAGR